MKRSIAVVALLISAQALAQGVVLSPGQLAPPVRTDLAAKIAAAKKSDPAAFEALANVRSALERLDQKKRGHQAALSPILRALGPSALYPIVNELAFSAAPRGELRSTAWAAWRLALLEVLGEQRSADTTPIFRAVLDGAETDFDLIRITAAALGERGDDVSAQALVTLSAGPKRDAVLAGMGNCRRLLVAQALAAAVPGIVDSGSLVRLARSLGMVGNSWAWQTPSVGSKAEEKLVRATAAHALVQIFVKGNAEVQLAASNAAMVVDAPETVVVIQEAKGAATGPTVAALDTLAQRFARNPVR